jgi:hypothetical protein
MGLEVAEFLSELVATNPTSTDFRSQGDDHLRLLKAVLQATFPDAEKAFYFPKSLSVSSNTTLQPEDSGSIVYVNANGGNINLTLPTGLGDSDAGWSVYILKIDNSENEVSIIGTVSDFNDPDLIGEHIAVTIGWNGSDFFLLGEPNLDLSPTIASGATTKIGLNPSKFITISGNADISSFGKGMRGQTRFLEFSGAARLMHSTPGLVCIGATNLQMASNYRAQVICTGASNWTVLYARTNTGESI